MVGIFDGPGCVPETLLLPSLCTCDPLSLSSRTSFLPHTMGQDPPSCHDVWAVLFSNACRQAQSDSFTSHCRLSSTGTLKRT